MQWDSDQWVHCNLIGFACNIYYITQLQRSIINNCSWCLFFIFIFYGHFSLNMKLVGTSVKTTGTLCFSWTRQEAWQPHRFPSSSAAVFFLLLSFTLFETLAIIIIIINIKNKHTQNRKPFAAEAGILCSRVFQVSRSVKLYETIIFSPCFFFLLLFLSLSVTLVSDSCRCFTLLYQCYI